MKRSDVFNKIIQLVVLSPHYYNVAVCLSTLDEVKDFKNEFMLYIAGIPDSLMPRMTYSTLRKIEFNNGQINIVNSAGWLQGTSLTYMFKSSALSDKLLNEFGEFEVIYTLRGNSCILTFDNHD